MLPRRALERPRLWAPARAIISPPFFANRKSSTGAISSGLPINFIRSVKSRVGFGKAAVSMIGAPTHAPQLSLSACNIGDPHWRGLWLKSQPVAPEPSKSDGRHTLPTPNSDTLPIVHAKRRFGPQSWRDDMNRRTRFAIIAAIVIIAAAIGGWTFVMGAVSKATIPGKASHEVQRAQSPSAPTLPTVWWNGERQPLRRLRYRSRSHRCSSLSELRDAAPIASLTSGHGRYQHSSVSGVSCSGLAARLSHVDHLKQQRLRLCERAFCSG